MALDFKAPENVILKPIITVIGVGGAGGNAVNNMIKSNLQGANFIVANTDAQALEYSDCPSKIQLGIASTKGLGAGADPEVGALAATESELEIRACLEGSNMVFITTGLGGGTGSGSSPVIARIAKELGILTVGVVTKPFLFEGAKRMRIAEAGLGQLQKYVDTLIIIPNQNLFRIANANTTFTEAFKMADGVLNLGVRGITDLITMPGLINLDFADIKTVMSEKGKAMMGTGEASGEERAIRAAEDAISNPLLDHSSMSGASGVLINITGGKDMTLYEVDSAANRIREEVGDTEANIIFGSTFNPDLEGIIRITVVATGIDGTKAPSSTDVNNKAAIISDSILDGGIAAETIFVNEELADQVPSFNEYAAGYSLTESDMDEEYVKVTPVQTDSAEEEIEDTTQKAAIAVAPVVSVTKPSLFQRMWNSIKTLDSAETESRYNEIDPVISKRKDSSPLSKVEVQDVPAFLRKK